MVVSLFSACWVLEALGQSDFGLYGVVGSVILIITFLNGGLSVGVGRFYAYSIGRKDIIYQKKRRLRILNTGLTRRFRYI